jgi:hypothetical protein
MQSLMVIFALVVLAAAGAPADTFRTGGGKVNFRVLAAYGGEGRWLAETDGGIRIAGPELERALKALSPAAAKKR